jgi:hypothetical protein
MTKRYIADAECTFSVEKMPPSGGRQETVVTAVNGYNPSIKELLTLTDTGNGLVSLYHSCASYKQDNYICLDYAEAEYLYYAIGEALKLRKKKAKKQ